MNPDNELLAAWHADLEKYPAQSETERVWRKLGFSAGWKAREALEKVSS